MLMPDFKRLFHAATELSSFAQVMTALAPITQGQSTEYVGTPDVVVKKDSVTIRAGGDLYVIFGERQALEWLIKSTLGLDTTGSDARFHIFRGAATELWHAKRYQLTYEYQKASLQKLSENPELRTKAAANLDRIAVVNGESPQSEEWRVLLSYSFQEMSDVVLSHGEHANELRRYSPLTGFISEEERGEIYARIIGRPLPPSLDLSALE